MLPCLFLGRKLLLVTWRGWERSEVIQESAKVLAYWSQERKRTCMWSITWAFVLMVWVVWLGKYSLQRGTFDMNKRVCLKFKFGLSPNQIWQPHLELYNVHYGWINFCIKAKRMQLLSHSILTIAANPRGAGGGGGRQRGGGRALGDRVCRLLYQPPMALFTDINGLMTKHGLPVPQVK